MRNGCHFLSGGFASGAGAHNPASPRFIQTDNQDFQRNIEITSVELMYTSSAIGSTNISGDCVFFVLARSEQAATPEAGWSAYNAQYGLRLDDPDIIAWGMMSALTGTSVIMSPHRIVPTNMWVNAWSVTAAHALTEVENSIGYAINMEMREESGTIGLLQTTISVAAQEN